jgi:hypothetical protein
MAPWPWQISIASGVIGGALFGLLVVAVAIHSELKRIADALESKKEKP